MYTVQYIYKAHAYIRRTTSTYMQEHNLRNEYLLQDSAILNNYLFILR